MLPDGRAEGDNSPCMNVVDLQSTSPVIWPLQGPLKSDLSFLDPIYLPFINRHLTFENFQADGLISVVKTD